MSFLAPLRDTLAEPNYRRYTLGNSVSLVGTWIQRVAVGWLAWELTHSATWLGVVAFADLCPAVILGPLGGAIADRVSPISIVRLTQIAMLIATVALSILTVSGAISIELLTALVFLQGAAQGFGQPARLALVYRLVPRERLPTAVALNAVVFNTARFVGPMFAGAALVVSGPGLAFSINAVSFIAFIAVLYRLDLPANKDAKASGKDSPSLLSEIAQGARYAFSHPHIGPLLLLAILLAVAVRPYVELLPGFADRVFGGGAAELAIMSSAIGLGAIVAGLYLAATAGTEPRARRVFLSAGIAALSVLLFALSEAFPVALIGLTISGGAMAVAGVTVQTALQLHVGTDYRARVMSLYGLVFRSGPAFGALLMGVAADWVGMQLPLVIGATTALLGGAWYWRRLSQKT